MATFEVELINMPYHRVWSSYDSDADVLYLTFKRPSHADDSELTDDDVIIRYEQGQIIGITILHASERNVNGLVDSARTAMLP